MREKTNIKNLNKRKFKTKNLKSFYKHLLNSPPINKKGLRRRGSTIVNEFWAGYDNIRSNLIHSSFAEIAYWAGMDYKKQKRNLS